MEAGAATATIQRYGLGSLSASPKLIPEEDAMGSSGEDIASIDADVNRWRSPHAEVERPEPMPHHSRTGRHADRRYRDEPVELARCRHCTWRPAPAVKEAQSRREHIAESAASMARGGAEGRTQD